MDAREQLRRFLEQRREAGETELVFDRLSVEEALRLLGALPTAGQGSAADGRAEERSVSVPANAGDWRTALRESGAPPVEKVPRLAMPVPSAASATESKAIALESIPQGIIIGGSGREQFAGTPKYATLEELSTAVSTCRLCSLYEKATNPVPGEGNANADFMCVGEAPGGTEDELGRPFVGLAGQLLDKILAAIKLSREDVYICNVLKHRPPGNRNPMPDEVQACSPYLLRQIELIQPRVIVAFGTFAAQTLLNTREGIGKLRAKVHRYYGVPLVVTYHPAALLRNPAWKKPTWYDVQLARKLLDRAISS